MLNRSRIVNRVGVVEVDSKSQDRLDGVEPIQRLAHGRMRNLQLGPAGQLVQLQKVPSIKARSTFKS